MQVKHFFRLFLLLIAGTTGLIANAASVTGPGGEQVFVRAIAYSPYHPQQGFDISDNLRGKDRGLLRGLNANTILYWQPLTSEAATFWQKSGFYIIPQITYTPQVQSFFVNGTQAPVPVFLNEVNRTGFRDAARDIASKLRDHPAILAVSIGNDWRWSAYEGNLGFTYGGFDDQNLLAFRSFLTRRFGSAEEFNQLNGGNVSSLNDVLPPIGTGPRPLFWEWWLYMRKTLWDYMDFAQEGLDAIGWKVPTLYQEPTGTWWDPGSEGATPTNTDIVAGNVFYQTSWDWRKFCASIQRLIASANGRPVLVTETGVHTHRTDDLEIARRLKQSVFCTLLHPEVAGIGLYEFNDEWQLSGNPKEQSDNSSQEHWGLVTAERSRKPIYDVTSSLFDFIRRNETMLKTWQSPPTVYITRQEQDWWKMGGPESTLYERLGGELYGHGVSFKIVDSLQTTKLDPAIMPCVIVCDAYLGRNPDGSGDAFRNIVDYIAGGGHLLYISRMPWQSIYGRLDVPPELLVPDDRTPITRQYGKGQFSVIPTYELEDAQLRYIVEDFLADRISQQATVKFKTPDDSTTSVFWRTFTQDGVLWLMAVNVTPELIPKIEVTLRSDINARRIQLRASDGASVKATSDTEFTLNNLNTWALIKLGQAPINLQSTASVETVTPAIETSEPYVQEPPMPEIPVEPASPPAPEPAPVPVPVENIPAPEHAPVPVPVENIPALEIAPTPEATPTPEVAPDAIPTPEAAPVL